MPRVALFASQFLPYSQTFIFDELRHHERYEADVFTRIRRNADSFPWPRVFSAYPAGSVSARLEGALYSITSVNPSFSRQIRDGGYDLIHAHFGTGSIYALRYQRQSKLPLVVTFHGYDVPLLLTPRRFWPGHWRYWLASGMMRRRTSLFLAASGELAQLLIQLGAPEERVKVWRLGIPIHPPCDGALRTGRRILMIGRFVEKKGFEYGIRAFAALQHDHPGLELGIVGDGPLEGDLRRLVVRLGMKDAVRFHGVLDQRGVAAALERADILFAPSVIARNGDRESGLLVAKEAAAMGLPVIGTWHGGIPEIIDDGVTGFLVPERNPDAITGKARLLLADGQLRRSLGGAARLKMEREYDIRDRVRVLESHYDSLLQGKI